MRRPLQNCLQTLQDIKTDVEKRRLIKVVKHYCVHSPFFASVYSSLPLFRISKFHKKVWSSKKRSTCLKFVQNVVSGNTCLCLTRTSNSVLRKFGKAYKVGPTVRFDFFFSRYIYSPMVDQQSGQTVVLEIIFLTFSLGF